MNNNPITPSKVLVVDDDVTARLLMRAALVRAGYAVDLAGSGEEALRVFDAARCDMVMLDVDMPGMSGHEVCAHLRVQAGELLPIVMVTGREDVDSVERAYECGATDFIAKPINWALIGHRVRYLFRAHATHLALRAANARNAAMLNALPDALFRMDASGMVLESRSPAGAGQAPQAGRWLAASWPDDIAARVLDATLRAQRTASTQSLEFSLHDPALGLRHLEARLAMIDEREALGLVRDITERKSAEAALIASQAQLEQAQAVARLGSWRWDPATSAIEWSTQACRILGWPAGARTTRERFLGMVLGESAAEVAQAWDDILAGQPYSIEFALQVEGRIVWVLEQAQVELDGEGRFAHIVGTVQDITERKETQTRIARLAYFDGLTGLPNRESFLERLGREIRRAERGARQLAVLFMDLDGFKAVNDTMGHNTGDLILQRAADRLRQALRPSDMVSRSAGEMPAEVELARLGGDEFTALIVDIARPEDVMALADRIHEQMRRPYQVDGRDVLLTTSTGIALYPGDGGDAMTLLKHADTAMYHAKETGRNHSQFYRASLTERAKERMDMTTSLRLALERGEFRLVYQPQFDVVAGRVLAVEALIRWAHPVQGLIPPLDFIPLAEENGLIVAIGQWVLRTACADAARWQRAGHKLRVGVNVSPLQFKDPALVQTVQDALAHTGLAPELLVLELTESAVMDDSGVTLGKLNALRECGVQFALDDFGTGYSSLSYLKRMPLSFVKVDRSFVSGLPEDGSNHAIVNAILSMADSLGFSVTAEGVETREQARTLTDMACSSLQGFYFGRPVPALEIPSALTKIADEERERRRAADSGG